MSEKLEGGSKWEQQIQGFKSSSQLVCLEKDGEEFFFDSTDLKAETEQELCQMLTQGWQVAKTEGLPAFLPARQAQIKKDGLVESDWGYKKQE